MRISDLRNERRGEYVRMSALVTWEERRRSPVEVFFDTPAAFAETLIVNANAFLVAAIFPAMEAGEQRIAVDDEICPRLLIGLQTVIRLFAHWFKLPGKPITIEARMSPRRRDNGRPARAGAFFTGGIDSMATLRRNRLVFPPSHEEYIRDGVLLYGINFDSDDSPETFTQAVAELSKVVESSGATLIPMITNVRRELNPDIEFFRFRYHAALLAAAAHALSGRLTIMSIGSTHDISHLMAWGSHPLLDSNLSSAAMRIYHDGLELSRFTKTKLVAEWEGGLHHIKVCVSNWPGRNCGHCEKCLRTMLALTAVDVLQRCEAFEQRTLNEEIVRNIHIQTESQQAFYGELVEPLRAAGRGDLARAVDFVLMRYRGELGIRGRLKLADRLYLGGGLATMKRSLSSRPSPVEKPVSK